MQLIKAHRDAILRALQIVAGIIERRHTQPILANVLITRVGDQVSLTGSDSEIQIRTTAQLAPAGSTNDAASSTTVAARKLLDILRSVPNDDLVTVSQTQQRLTVAAGRSRFTLQALDASAFPTAQLAADPNNQLEVPQATLKTLLGQVHYAMAQQDIRFYLNGLLMLTQGGSVTAVATDAHRLAVATASVGSQADEPNSPVAEFIIPRKTVLELQRLLADRNEPVKIDVSASQARFRFVDDKESEIELVSKLVEGRFPDWQRVIPQNHDRVMTVNREVFTKTLSRVAILTGEKFRAVHFKLEAGLLKIQAQNSDQEEATDEIEIEYSGPELEVGFNVSYLLDCLNNLKSESVIIHFGESGSSALLTVPELEGFRYVVMPVRI